jgi:hypothetical protein
MPHFLIPDLILSLWRFHLFLKEILELSDHLHRAEASELVNLPARELRRADSNPGKKYFPPQVAILDALRVKGQLIGGEVWISPGSTL